MYHCPVCQLLEDIKRLLPDLEDLVACWEPSWDDVVEDDEMVVQREEWAIAKTAHELLVATVHLLDTDA